MTEQQRSSQTLSVQLQSLFRESWARYKPLWKQLALITIVFYVFTIVVETIMAVLGIGGFGLAGLATLVNGDTIQWEQVVGIGALAILVLVFVELLLASWLQATIITAIHDNAPNASFSSLALKGRRVTNRVFGSTLLSILLIVIGFILLFVPGVYLAIAFAFVAYVATLEDLGGSASLRRSREIVRGKWWDVFVSLFVLGFGLGLVSIILDTIAGQLGGTPLQGIVSVITGIVLTPFGAVYTYLLYKRLAGK